MKWQTKLSANQWAAVKKSNAEESTAALKTTLCKKAPFMYAHTINDACIWHSNNSVVKSKETFICMCKRMYFHTNIPGISLSTSIVDDSILLLGKYLVGICGIFL